MSRTAGSDDQETLFLDNLIALAQDVIDLANQVKEISDEPEVLYRALKGESAGLIIQHRCREYRPRLKLLKSLALAQTGGDLRPAEKKKGSPARASQSKEENTR